MNDWFRSWHGAPTDNKWLVIAKKAGVAPGVVSAVVWALFDHASQAGERGSVAGFDVETYAAFSGFDEAQIAAVIAALKDKGVINGDDHLAAWEKRQPKREDDSAVRAKEWRERKRQEAEREQAEAERKRTQPNASDGQIRGEEKREEEEAPAARAKIDVWLRSLVGEEPVLVDPNTEPVAELLDKGYTAGDIEGGIREAMADPTFRPRHWKQLVGWIKRARQDRLAGKAKWRPPPDMPKPRSDETWTEFVRRWQDGKGWLVKESPQPNEPGTLVPKHILVELGVRAAA
jgi:hypothetical protein